MIHVWWNSRRKNRNVSNEMLPDCNDRSLSLWAEGVTDREAASPLTWAQFVPTSLPETLERNKVDQWAISTPTHASFLTQFSSTHSSHRTLMCSQTVPMTMQWRGVLHFKYLLPLKCRSHYLQFMHLSLPHLPRKCVKSGHSSYWNLTTSSSIDFIYIYGIL